MIKILFFIETIRMGGAERVLCNLVNNMDRSRFDITVQTLWKCDAERYLSDGIQYRYCFSEQNARTKLLMRAEAAAGLIYPLHIKDTYDIECAFLEFAPTKIIAASTNKHAKKIAWVHCDLKSVIADTGANLEKCRPWYKKFNSVVCVSENVRQSYVDIFGNNPESTVLHNVINDTMIRQKAQMPLPAGITKRKKTIVSLGRLESQKNYRGLLRIHKRLIEEGFDYDLWIIGKGSENNILQEYIEANNLSDSVHLLGFFENPYPFLREADFLVCSSKYEGFSTFVTEGLILGKAIVTTDCTGMQELLGDSTYGLITKKDEDSLYEGIKKMLMDEHLCNRYADKALQRGKDFSADTLVRDAQMLLSQIGEQ